MKIFLSRKLCFETFYLLFSIIENYSFPHLKSVVQFCYRIQIILEKETLKMIHPFSSRSVRLEKMCSCSITLFITHANFYTALLYSSHVKKIHRIFSKFQENITNSTPLAKLTESYYIIISHFCINFCGLQRRNSKISEFGLEFYEELKFYQVS